ncbi:MAG TPA: carbon-nitrogen hydrolase family protein [Solirubrobacteraceae bacterium]|nr:carbon-nitrogen hydrolase family protein [Solirubrobacteraceae bacterium]
MNLRAAAIQLNSTEDKQRNLATADRLTRAAAAQGAELVVLPEKFNQLAEPERMSADAEPLDGQSLQWAGQAARELNIDLIAGSIVERSQADPDARFNTSVHIGRDGLTRAVYRKLHLFDVEVAGTTYRESDCLSAGDEIVVSHTAEDVEVGMTICYDLRFPELYRILTARGARVLAVPSAFTLTTTRDHWEPLLRARAIENQCFVIAANQIGTSPPGNRSGGRSMIVDPWGVVLAQAPDEETAIVADCELARQREIRERLPALSHRREDAYRWPHETHA